MPKISDRSDIGNLKYWDGFVSAPRVAVSVSRGVVGAANTSRLAAAGRRSGNNTCECFIESSFNAYLDVMLLQDRGTPVT